MHPFISLQHVYFCCQSQLSLPVVEGKKMLSSIFLTLEYLTKIECLNHLWALIYISPNIVEVVVAEVGN